MQKVTAKIHLGNIRRNAEKFRNLTGNRLCAVVKANAYGHGAEEIVNALEGVADCFAVALIEEGLAIRTAACGKDVLVFTPPWNEEQAFTLITNDFLATVGDIWTAKLLTQVCEKYCLRVRIHLKINTGMNRYGMELSQTEEVCDFLKENPFLVVEGIYTHIYNLDRRTAKAQRTLFLQAVELCRRRFPCVMAHLGGTYAAMLGKEFALDMTRVGLGLYGYFPTKEQNLVNALHLEKGMSVYGVVAATRKVSFGGIGYGNPLKQKHLKAIGRVSLCRYGYADGVLRRKDNGVEGWENNLNTLCMDVCLQSSNKQRGECIPILLDADKTAKQTGTIAYEVLCAATRRAEFVYDNE